VVLNRETGNCLICHQVPEPAEAFQGSVGPPLAGVGARLDAGQLRLRLIDQTLINPMTLMPPYYRTEKLTRVGVKFRDRPVLAPQEIEDVVVYLTTLKP
jgi:L-cysteine S-thiosulfotransferase